MASVRLLIGLRRAAVLALSLFAALAAPASAVEREATIGAVESYLNSLKSLSAKFVQYGSDGSVAMGDFYLSRPGRLRFAYDPPSQILIVADGYWLAFVDPEARQMNRWPINDTPLGVLARETVNLRKDVEVTRVEEEGGVIRLAFRDSSEPGRGEMVLIFTEGPIELKQWRVTDAQGFETTVSLSDAVENAVIDPALFTYQDPRPNRPLRGPRKR